MSIQAAPATGWAIVKEGKILVHTVSPTRRAAIVNYMVTEGKIMIFQTDTDDYIEGIWQTRFMGERCHCTTVKIEVMT